jgi:hypothetical protein
MEVNQAGKHQEAAGIDDLFGVDGGIRSDDGRYLAVRYEEGADLIDTGGRVDDPAAPDCQLGFQVQSLLC